MVLVAKRCKSQPRRETDPCVEETTDRLRKYQRLIMSWRPTPQFQAEVKKAVRVYRKVAQEWALKEAQKGIRPRGWYSVAVGGKCAHEAGDDCHGLDAARRAGTQIVRMQGSQCLKTKLRPCKRCEGMF